MKWQPYLATMASQKKIMTLLKDRKTQAANKKSEMDMISLKTVKDKKTTQNVSKANHTLEMSHKLREERKYEPIKSQKSDVPDDSFKIVRKTDGTLTILYKKGVYEVKYDGDEVQYNRRKIPEHVMNKVIASIK